MGRSLTRTILAMAFIFAAPANSEAARGGPDAGGWSWADSDEVGVDDSLENPPSWTTIVATWLDEDVVPVTLTFPFTLYNVTSDTIWISSNGWISLLDPGGVARPDNSPLPSPITPPNATIAYFWDDLDRGFAMHGSTAAADLVRVRHFQKTTGDIVQVVIQFGRDGHLKIVYQSGNSTDTVSIGIENDAGTQGTQLVYDGTTAPGFSLSAKSVLFYPASISSCGAPTPLACGASVTGTTAGGGTGAASYGCSGFSYSGRDRVYQLTPGAVQYVDLTLGGLGGRDLDLFVLRPACDAVIDCVDGGADVVGPVLLGAGTSYIVVDGRGPGDDGAFTLDVACSPASTPIACNSTVSDTLSGSGGIDAYDCWGADMTGPEKIYSFNLPATRLLTAQLSPPVPFDVLLVDQATMEPVVSSCLTAGSEAFAILDVPPGDYALIVDGPTGATGTFDLTLGCYDVLPTIPIDCGDVDVRGASSIPSLVDFYTGCNISRVYRQGEVFYDFRPASRVIITASATDPVDYDLFAFREADAFSSCLEFDDATIQLGNLPVDDYLFVLDSDITSGPTGLSLSCTTMATTPLGCTASTPGVTSLASALDIGPCLDGAPRSGGEAYFTYDAAAGEPFVVELEGVPAGADLDLAIVQGPFDMTRPLCLTAGDDTVSLINPTASEYLIIVDGNPGATGTPFDLDVTCGSLDPTCSGVSSLACETNTSGDTTGRPAQTWTYGSIFQNYTGPEQVFHFSNPIAQPVAFQLTSVSDDDLDLILLRGCDSSQVVGWGDTEVVIPNLSPGDYYVVVDGRDDASGTFDLIVRCSWLSGCASPPYALCGETVTGDTLTGASTAWLYGSGVEMYTGPELVYRFWNPVTQPVSLQLMSVADPRIDVLILDGCTAVEAFWRGDDEIILPNLDAGEYFIVIDGREGVGGAFELSTLCGPATLEPSVLRTRLAPGECYTEVKHLYFPPTVPAADLVFSFDLSGSMSGELDQLKTNVGDVFTKLNRLIPSLRFGLATFLQYASPYFDTVCDVGQTVAGAGHYEFKLDLAPTADIAEVSRVLDTIAILRGAVKETYTRTFYEAYANPDIGWRGGCTRLLWMSFGDELPVDCNVFECIGGDLNTGRDPGPDLITGTADDLELLPTVDRMAANGITLLPVDSSEDPTNIDLWDCLAQRTGGQMFEMTSAGVPFDGSSMADALVEFIIDSLRDCPEVRLEATGPFASWVTITPPTVFGVRTPFDGDFTVEFCVPPATPFGIYPLEVEARCLGAGACAVELLATQTVELTVDEPCVPPTPQATEPAPICEGATVTLDGAASAGCSASSLQYRWLDGATVLCDWSPNPTCDVAPPTTTSYTLEVACVDAPDCVATSGVTVDVVPIPSAALEPLSPICVGDVFDLDATTSDPRGCPVPLEYRFLEGAVEIAPWGPLGTHGLLTPGASTTYTVEVRCTASPACMTSMSQPVEVVPNPIANAGPGESVCEFEPSTLDASSSTDPGCPGGLLYEWRAGPVVVRPKTPDPAWTPPTDVPGTTTYTVVVSCASPPSCESSDDVIVEVRSCPLAVHFDSFDAVWKSDGASTYVLLSWATLMEDGSLGFMVERADALAGPFAMVGDFVGAEGPGYPYRFEDDSAEPGTQPWYRVVEYTIDGRGDETPVLQVRESDGRGDVTGGRGRSRSRRRTR